MSAPIVFNGVDDVVKQRLEALWSKKRPRLEKLLAAYPADLREISMTITRHRRDAQRGFFEARGVIRLPIGTVAAEDTDENPEALLDRVVDTLVEEVRRHREKARRDSVYKRKNRDRADLSAAGPRLQQHADAGGRDDFFRMLRPHLRYLRDYARREIRRLERDGTLHPGELEVEDLLDQVALMAYDRFNDRPRKVSLDLWLTELVDDALEQWVKQEPRPHVSLEEAARNFLPPEPPGEDEEPWWAELMGEDETLRLEDLIPDSEGSEAWKELEAEEQTERLLALIARLPPARREAFVLHVLEGYATDEIAMLQDRPESEVKADIEAARRWLRESLQVGGFVGEAAASGGDIRVVATR